MSDPYTKYSFEIGALSRSDLMDRFAELSDDDASVEFDEHLDSDSVRAILLEHFKEKSEVKE